MKENNKFILLLIGIVSLITIAYSPLFNNNVFYYDDITNILNKYILTDNFSIKNLQNALFYKAGGFRPISYVSFYLNNLMCNSNIACCMFKLNFLIHIFNTVLVFFVIKYIFNSKPTAITTTFLWGISPVNFYAVGYTVQRMTSLMTFFGLIAVLFSFQFFNTKKIRYIIFILIFITLSTLSKENGILFIPAIIIVGVIKNNIKINKKNFYLFGIVSFFIFLFSAGYYYRYSLASQSSTPVFRIISQINLLPFYIQNLVFPQISKLFLYLNFKSQLSFGNLLGGVIILLSSFWLFWRYEKKQSALSISILLFFLFQILENTVIPLRYSFLHRMYLPSIFFYGLISYSLIELPKNNLFKIISITVFGILFFSTTLAISTSWISPYYYLSENIKSYPNNPDLIGAYAKQLKHKGEINKSLEYLEKGLKISPTNIYLQKNYLNTLIILKQYKKAIVKGKTFKTNSFNLHQLGKAYYYSGNTNKAIELLKQSLDKSQNEMTYIDLLRICESSKQYKLLIFLGEKYSTYFANSINGNLKIVNAHIQLGNIIKAEDKLKKIPDCFTKNYLEALILYKREKYNKSLEKALSLNENVPIGNLLRKVYLIKNNYIALNQKGKALSWVNSFLEKQFPLQKAIIKKQLAEIITNLQTSK